MFICFIDIYIYIIYLDVYKSMYVKIWIYIMDIYNIFIYI